MLKILLEGGAKVDNPVKNVGPKALSRKGIEGKKADIKK